MISPMLPKLCVAVGCPEQGNHCLRLQIKLLICTAHVYFGKVAGTRLLNLILTLDFYELGVLRNRYSYALQGCQQYSLNTTLRPNYCTGVVISTVRCSYNSCIQRSIPSHPTYLPTYSFECSIPFNRDLKHSKM